MKKNVLKIAIVALFCFGFNLITNAQTIFSEGDRVVNLGIGLGDYLGGAGYSSSIPISGSFEYGIKDNLFDEKSSLGVGGYLAYASNKYTYLDNTTFGGWKYSHFVLGARGLLHYQFVDKLDTYAGLMLGYDVVSSSAYGNLPSKTSATGSGFGFSLFVGGRYYFTENIAAFAEIGYGIAALQLGVAFKF
ncbi:MAG: hypothetical protein LBT27_10075 [Prevotellaceae bacterium]|jgi:hypothetical protein|nr:hypothetical protein [Prevotellaceae bacterium]